MNGDATGHQETKGGLFPSVFNLAADATVTANATCGQLEPEIYCKLVEHVYVREPQCGVSYMTTTLFSLTHMQASDKRRRRSRSGRFQKEDRKKRTAIYTHPPPFWALLVSETAGLSCSLHKLPRLCRISHFPSWLIASFFSLLMPACLSMSSTSSSCLFTYFTETQARRNVNAALWSFFFD